jgi:hypothetical protein
MPTYRVASFCYVARATRLLPPPVRERSPPSVHARFHSFTAFPLVELSSCHGCGGDIDLALSYRRQFFVCFALFLQSLLEQFRDTMHTQTFG